MYPSTIVTAAVLADLLGLSIRRISDLDREGTIVRAPGGGYDLRGSIRGYAVRQRQRTTAAGLTAARERLLSEQADAPTTKNSASRGELLNAAAVQATWGTVLRDLRDALLVLPSRAQQAMPHLTAAEIAALDREVRDILTRLSHDEL